MKKRLVKAPKVYVRDTGILHTLLGMGWTRAAQLAHPKAGASWETFCIEQLIAHAKIADPASEAFFYRTQTGVEIDLVIVLRGEPIGFEIKLGITPQATRAMAIAMADIGMRRAFQVNASDQLTRLTSSIQVGGLRPLLQALRLRPLG